MAKLTTNDHDYQTLEDDVATTISLLSGPLFTVDIDPDRIWDIYLGGLPIRKRQHYNCRCCRNFLERYGSLVTIDEKGRTHAAIWDKIEIPRFFKIAIGGIIQLCEGAKVSNVFLSSDLTWGKPRTEDQKRKVQWTHLHGTPDSKLVFRHPLLTASQMAAEKLQDYSILTQGLMEFPIETVRTAVAILESDALYRSEKVLGVAQWLLALHERLKSVKLQKYRQHIRWSAVATAPVGWCHIRSTMISTLLEDINSNMYSFEDIGRRWKEKMNPLQYQRPTMVKQGTLIQANAVVAKLESEGALARRYARLDEVQAYWTPTTYPVERTGPFDGLVRTGSGPALAGLIRPPKLMTWEKFRSTVLDRGLVNRMDFLVPNGLGPFFAMVTATDPNAAPILQWANPVSWFFRAGGVAAGQWNLTAGTWVKVNAVCDLPPHWGVEGFTHYARAACLILEGARPLNQGNGGLFFPECLRSEYHGIRSAMEAYSQSHAISGIDRATANGYALQSGSGNAYEAVLLVNGTQQYKIDRWE